MSSLNQQSLIAIVNQSNGRPADGIPGDRASVLGNPFDMQRQERLRDPVCDAHDEYFDAVVVEGAEPVPTATRIAKARGLALAPAWKRPSRQAFMGALAVLEQRQADGKPSEIMCWCYPSRCHLDKDKAYLDEQRSKSQTQSQMQVEQLETAFRAMPEAPARAQNTDTAAAREAVMETNIADSIQLIGQLPQPMLDTLAARLETVKSSLNADVSNYARGRLSTWVGVQWDLKDKRFVPAGFWDAQLWEFGQRVYPGCQMLLLTYSGDGTGIGLHRDDSYARFEARTVSLETQNTESTWFMRQTYPGMVFSKEQNEAAGVHEFGLPSGSVITFNCKNQHAVEPGAGRWSLNLWQVSDKHQAAYRTFIETYGQPGGAVPHVAQGRDLIMPKPLTVTAAQRQQLNAPTVRQVWRVADFNSRPKATARATAATTRSATRESRTPTNSSTANATTDTKSEPEAPGETAVVYQWSRYAPGGKQGYECSTQGDRRFSALNAKLQDGRTIEEAYQLDVKGYRAQGNDWRLGKGNLPLLAKTTEGLYNEYKGLWQQWATENPELMDTLAALASGKVLTDKFASTPISQARALAELLNERQLTFNQVEPVKVGLVETQATEGVETITAQPSPDRITSLTANQVFVFGSNTQGRHGKGAALQAVAFGAEYGNPRGRQGQAYAIATKDLTLPQGQQLRSVSLNEIESQITTFLEHVIAHPENEFLVTRFGCDLAGYTEQEIGGLWIGKDIPANVRLPQAFLDVLQNSAAIAPERQTTEGVEAITDQAKLEQPKPHNPLRDLTPLNPKVTGPMQKDIAMGEVATQFIGRSAAPAHTPSSTRNYEREWAKLGRSNTGVYTPEDVVMVSGSGPWRGVTQAQIQQTFQQHYEPLLEKVVKAKATVVVGSAQGTDQLVQQWLPARGYRLSPENGYMRVEPPVREKAAQNQATRAVTTTPATLVVVSGGQTGAGFGGLKAGKALGLETGGTAPHGWLVERCARFPSGTNPGLADYGLVEGPHGNNTGHTYILRTEINVQNSDGTLVLGSIDPVQDKGSFRTVELAERHRKPYLHVSVTDLFKHPNESVLRIKDWVLDEGIETLNVAGNRESNCPGLEDRVETVLKVALAEVVRVRTAIAKPQTTNGDTMTLDQTTPIVIACDGACSGNPGPGGYGTIVQYPDGTEAILVGNALETTNNRMELQGLLAGLQAVYSNSEAALTFSQNPVHVLTDSDLTIKCAKGDWKRKANRDLWQEYDQLPTSRPLTFEWVRGHNGHELNERCDKLAVAQSQLAKQGKISEQQIVQVESQAPAAEPTPQLQPDAPVRFPTYLSLNNGQLQQHATWPECQAATSGVSGAKYKKVKDDLERTQTLEQWGVSPEPDPLHGTRLKAPVIHAGDESQRQL